MINENFESVSVAAKFAYKASQSSGMRFAYYGGTQTNTDGTVTEVTDGYVTCVINKVNYIQYSFVSKSVEVNQTGFTDKCITLYEVTCDSSKITKIVKKTEVAFMTKGSTIYSGSGGGAEIIEIVAPTFSNTETVFSVNKDEVDLTKSVVKLYLRCKIRDFGYQIGDLIEFGTDAQYLPIHLDNRSGSSKRVIMRLINNKLLVFSNASASYGLVDLLTSGKTSSFELVCKIFHFKT